MLNIIIDCFAWLGLFCFLAAIGGLALALGALRQFEKEDKARREQAQTSAVHEAEKIISQLL